MMGELVLLEEHEAALCVALATAAGDAADILSTEVVGVVPPRLRGQVLHVSGWLAGERLYGPALRRDLVALVERLRPLVDAGRFIEWHADENDVHGGHEVVVFGPNAGILHRAIIALRDVEAASKALTAFGRAMQIRAQLPVV
jgi:hypothetical protein